MSQILVIDDDAAIRTVLHTVLTREGHTVRVAKDGVEGLTAFEEDKPDLVITDIIMPQKEGIETIQAVRRICQTVPIIAISGGGRTAASDYLPFAEKFGANATLHKPFGMAALLDLVRQTLPAA